MYDLILQLILMVSLGIVVYLMAAAVPRVEEGSKEENVKNNTIHLSLDKMDVFLNRLKDRSLRRLKVLVMKTDNFISKQLNKEEE